MSECVCGRLISFYWLPYSTWKCKLCVRGCFSTKEARGAIPGSLWRIIVGEAEKKGTTPEALTVRLLLRLAPEEEKPRILLEAARGSLAHADRYAESGDYGEALYRVWGAVLLAVEALLSLEGKPLPEDLAGYFSAVLEAGGVALEAWTAAFTGNALARVEGIEAGLLEKYFSYAKEKAQAFLGLVEEEMGGK